MSGIAPAILVREYMLESVERGFDKVSVNRLTDKAGCCRQTFYYYFSSPFSVVEWLYKHDMPNLVHPDPSASDIQILVYRIVKVTDNNLDFFRSICASSKKDELAKYISGLFAEKIAETISGYQYDYDGTENVPFVAGFLADSMAGALVKNLVSEDPIPSGRLLNYLDAFARYPVQTVAREMLWAAP